MLPSDIAAGRIRTVEISDAGISAEGLRFLTLYSPALAGRGDVTVFTPPASVEVTSVPIVLLLHGVYGSHWSWFLQGDAHRTAMHLMKAGRIRTMLLVAPSDGLFQDGSAYLRHSGRDYESWVIQDVIEGMGRSFSCVGPHSPLFIAGLSMGGYGALRLGAKHAGVFRGISAHSAITRIDEMSQFVSEPFPFDQLAAAETDLLGWFERNREKLPPLRFDCGTRDSLLEGNRRFHHELLHRSIPHEYAEFDGEHDWRYWRTHFASSLLFFENIMQAADRLNPGAVKINQKIRFDATVNDTLD
jgi:putative tributyrin esterase